MEKGELEIRDIGAHTTLVHDIVVFTNLSWLVLLLFWIAAAPFAKKIVQQESLIVWAIQMAAFVVALYLVIGPETPPDWFSAPAFRVSPSLLVFGLILATVGIVFTIWARIALGRNWSSSSALKRDHQLIRTGPYYLVRHPIYTGLSAAFLGSALEHGLIRSLVGLAICGIGFWLRIRTEESLMLQQFDAEYIQYRRETAAIVPYLL